MRVKRHSLALALLYGASLLCGASLGACERNETKAPVAPSEPEVVPAPEVPPDGAAEAEAARSSGDEVAPPPASEPPVLAVASKDTPAAVRAALRPLVAWAEKHGGRVHTKLVDLASGQALLAQAADVPVNPASNMKLMTAAAALDLLGPSFTMKTELRGRIDGSGRAEVLAIEGGGAPDLQTADLYRLARVAIEQGLTKVGSIVVDQELFSEQYVPPAFEQQPDEWAAFRAPISALALNRNSIDLNVVPTSPGSAAKVWYEPPGVVRREGEVETAAAGSGDHVRWSLQPKGEPARPVSVVGGKLAAGLSRRRYSRRMADPRLAGGFALASVLGQMGVEVGSTVQLGSADRWPRLAYIRSAPLSELIRPLGKDSDNFTAEMLLVALSSAAPELGIGKDSTPWASQRGAQVLESWLDRGPVDTENLKIENGSGLFDANRVTSDALVHVLRRMEERPEVFAEYLGQLAILGTDGTLEKRGRNDEFRGRVRAKTGTLRNVNALSGYILRRGGARPVAFSLIVSGVLGRHGEARRLMDRTVSAWATALIEE